MAHKVRSGVSVILTKIDNGTRCSAKGEQKTNKQTKSQAESDGENCAFPPDASAGAEKLIGISISQNKDISVVKKK